jgi:hypothetical protein
MRLFIINSIEWFLEILWAYTSIPKLFNMKRFHYVMQSQIIPKWLSEILYLILPFSELFLSSMLIFEATSTVALLLSSILMLIFTIYIGGAAFHLYELELCPCGKVFAKMSWMQHFWVNLIITFLAFTAFTLAADFFSIRAVIVTFVP